MSTHSVSLHAPTALLRVQPILYTNPDSIWATAAHLALFVLRCRSNVDPNELTYNVLYSVELEIDADFRVVNLAEGANFDPEYLKIVSKE